jgi:beta-glucanase (GH16 family)
MIKRIALIVAMVIYTIILHAQQWNLVWSDEFNDTTGSLNTANWVYETGYGNWGNSELENYTSRPENVKVAKGNLMIIGKAESYLGSSYTSGRLKTLGKQSWQYGKVEAKIKIPTGKGIWPAFWMMGTNINSVNWPNCGEIDIMEHINSDSTIYGTMHWYNGGTSDYGGTKQIHNINQYHIYTVEWDSTAITWFIDSVQYWKGSVANNVNNTNAFHKPFFILLNLAIGGSWSGNPDGTTIFPDTMFVDYVRVYQKPNPISESSIVKASNDISIYPNPTRDSFTVNCDEPAIIELYSITGTLLSLTDQTESVVISIKNKPAGIYYVKVITKNGVVTKQLLIE